MPTTRIRSGCPTSPNTPPARGLYCCAIKDVFSNRIVGYSIDDRMTAGLAVSALRSAIARRQPDGTVVVHSDRGSQFRSRARAELRYAIVTWIEHTYNRRRRQRGLGKLTPVEFELAFTAQPDTEDAAQAA